MSQTTRSPRLVAALLAAATVAGGCASTVSEGSRAERTRIEAGNAAYDVELTRDRINTRHVVDGSVDAVWTALPEAFASLGLQGDVVDDATHQFGIPRYRLAPHTLAHERLSRLLSCGSTATGPKADSYEVRYIMVTRVSRAERGTQVETRLEAVARPRGVSSRPIECSSTGVLEQALADSLTAKLAGGGDALGLEPARRLAPQR